MNSLYSYIYWNPSETIIQIGSFAPRWYGLFWMVGLLLGAAFMFRLYKAQGIKEDEAQRLFIYVFLSVFIGARLGHCIFYEANYYFSSFSHFLEIVLPIRFSEDGSWKYIGITPAIDGLGFNSQSTCKF